MARLTETETDLLVVAVWEWIIEANNGRGGDVDDLITVMNEHHAPCPPGMEDQ